MKFSLSRGERVFKLSKNLGDSERFLFSFAFADMIQRIAVILQIIHAYKYDVVGEERINFTRKMWITWGILSESEHLQLPLYK